MIRRRLRIENRAGLHARAAALLVQTASRYRSSIQIERNGERVNGKSIMGVMMLAASMGTEVDLLVDGPDEAAAVEAIEALVAGKFGEP